MLDGVHIIVLGAKLGWLYLSGLSWEVLCWVIRQYLIIICHLQGFICLIGTLQLGMLIALRGILISFPLSAIPVVLALTLFNDSPILDFLLFLETLGVGLVGLDFRQNH